MSKFRFSDYHLELIRDYPHLLGHMLGKTKLTDIHSDWIRYIFDADTPLTKKGEHRALMAHRGSYKTTCIEVGCVRHLLFNPNDRLGLIYKKFTRATDIVKTVSEMMKLSVTKTLFKYAHGFNPIARTRKADKKIYNFKTTLTPEGNLNAYGIDQSITGNHFDLIIADDFVDVDDRLSKAVRDRTKERVRELQTNIIDPGKHIAFVGTPWHRDDAWALCPEPIKFDVYSCGILDELEIEKKRTLTTPVLFSANYELTHISEADLMFADPIFGTWDWRCVNIRAQLDAAFDGNHTCALTIIGRGRDNRLKAKGWVWPGNVEDYYTEIVKNYRKYNCLSIDIENNADKGATAKDLTKRGLNVNRYDESMNKHNKISVHLYKHWKNIDWDETTDQDYMLQVRDYRKGEEPDDAPDSAASLLRNRFSESFVDPKDDPLYNWGNVRKSS